MRALAQRMWFTLCLALGRLLRSVRYTTTRIVDEGGERVVRKRRASHAPLLVWLGRPAMWALDTGVAVLPRRRWEAREREMYGALHGAPVRVDRDGTLVLPCLAGSPLAALLDDPALDERARMRAIGLAVAALAALHRRGVTHGDAMAENVLVDIEGSAAHWIDFETLHDPRRSVAWRRGDDLRALLATIVLRTNPATRNATVRHVVDAYADDAVSRLLVAAFSTAPRRTLAFHLAQALLSFDAWREVAGALRARLAP